MRKFFVLPVFLVLFSTAVTAQESMSYALPATMISVLIVSGLSLIGVLFLGMNQKILEKLVFFLISFASGALLGDAFLHLLPQAAEEFGFGIRTSLSVLAGIVIFFVIEKIIHWRHCHIHVTKHTPQPYAVMNLFGDGVHNYIDGLVIGATYLISFPLGLATTLAVILHEIPQEIADFAILIKGGFSRRKALGFNFLTALMAVLGGLTALYFGGGSPAFLAILIPVTAGHFIYVAGTDLIPELHKETSVRKSAVQLLGILVGILFMSLLLLLE